MKSAEIEFAQMSVQDSLAQRTSMHGSTYSSWGPGVAPIAKNTTHGAQSDLPAVVLVHGILNGSRAMVPLANGLKKRGRTTLLAELTPNLGQLSIGQYAAQLKRFVDRELEPCSKIDLVGFSMGGVVAQTFIQLFEGYSRVRRFISIAAPHQGTLWANLATAAGIIDMRCGSAHLKRLSNLEHLLYGIEITTIRTPFDGIIVPSSSSKLTMATNHVVPVIAHSTLLRSEAVHRLVIQGLG